MVSRIHDAPKAIQRKVLQELKTKTLTRKQAALKYGVTLNSVHDFYLGVGTLDARADLSKATLRRLFGGKREFCALVKPVMARQESLAHLCTAQPFTVRQVRAYATLLGLDLRAGCRITYTLSSKQRASLRAKIKSNKYSLLTLCKEFGVSWDSLHGWVVREGLPVPNFTSCFAHKQILKTKEYGCSKSYYAAVRALTNMVYRRYRKQLNPRGVRIGQRGAYQVDHLLSVSDGWARKIKVPIRHICHPANLKVVPTAANIRKQGASAFSYTKLKSRIRAWNTKYGNPTFDGKYA